MLKKILLFAKSNMLFKNLSVYFLSQLITAFLPIIIIPIISRTLSLNDYGSYSLYKSIFGFIIPLVGLSFSNAVIRKYYSIEKKDFKSYMFTLMVIMTVASIVLYFILLLNLNYLLRILKTDDSTIVFYALYVAYFTCISAILMSYYRVINNVKKYLLSNIIIIFATIAGVIFLKNQGILKLENLLIIHLVAIVISVVYNLFTFFDKESKIVLNFSKINETFIYCSPLVVYSLLAQVYAVSDRFFINYFLDKDSLALYSAGIQMAFVIPMLGQSIQLAWTPYVFERLTAKREVYKLKKITLILSGLLFVFSIFYVVLYPFIFKLFLPRSYDSVLNYYFLFIIAGLFQSLYWLYNPFLLFYEKNTYFIYITLFAAVISVVLNSFFVKNGLVWVASVFMLSWFIQFICLLIAIRYVKNSK